MLPGLVAGDPLQGRATLTVKFNLKDRRGTCQSGIRGQYLGEPAQGDPPSPAG